MQCLQTSVKDDYISNTINLCSSHLHIILLVVQLFVCGKVGILHFSNHMSNPTSVCQAINRDMAPEYTDDQEGEQIYVDVVLGLLYLGTSHLKHNLYTQVFTFFTFFNWHHEHIKLVRIWLKPIL